MSDPLDGEIESGFPDSRLRQRRDEIVRLAETAASRFGCKCDTENIPAPPHDEDCLRGMVENHLVSTLVWWDHYLAWEVRDREALALAEAVAQTFEPMEDAGAEFARKEEAYLRWKANLA